MEKRTKQSAKLKSLLKDISIGKEEIILNALKQLESYGDITVIPSLLNRLEIEKSSEVVKAIVRFLGNVQDEEIVEALMTYIRQGQKKEILSIVLPCIWNSKHNYSAYIADFVSLSIEEDYLIALECLTILEQMPGPFEESWLLEAQLFLKEYHQSSTLKEEKKTQIISEIARFVKAQNEGVDADLIME